MMSTSNEKPVLHKIQDYFLKQKPARRRIFVRFFNYP